MSDSGRAYSAAQQKIFVAKVADNLSPEFVEKIDPASTWMALQLLTLDTTLIGMFAHVGCTW